MLGCYGQTLMTNYWVFLSSLFLKVSFLNFLHNMKSKQKLWLKFPPVLQSNPGTTYYRALLCRTSEKVPVPLALDQQMLSDPRWEHSIFLIWWGKILLASKNTEILALCRTSGSRQVPAVGATFTMAQWKQKEGGNEVVNWSIELWLLTAPASPPHQNKHVPWGTTVCCSEQPRTLSLSSLWRKL